MDFYFQVKAVSEIVSWIVAILVLACIVIVWMKNRW